MTVKNAAPVADWVSIDDLYRDPFPIYERLRREGGVHWVPSVGRYLITSYAAVHDTETNQEVFSANEEGSLQIRAMGHSMLRRDDPEHYPERKAWQPVLRPGVVKRVWTSVFEKNADKYLNKMLEKGSEGDLIWDFAAPYSAENLREIIGLHNATQEDLQRWSQTMIDATGNYADDPEVWAKGLQSFEEVDIALDEMLHWHAKNQDHSLLSSLLRIPDYEMPIEKIRANVKMTIGGGLNEPRDAIGVAAWAMLTHPEQLQSAQADPALWQTVFDESIRWIAPIGLYSRQVTRDTELQGVALPAGAKLGICILSANRDERIWDRPEIFDIGREVQPHLAFSKGVHVCLGAWVARAEVANIALPAMFRRLQGLRLREDAPAEIGGWVFRGMLKLPVAWDSSSKALGQAPKLGAALPKAGNSGGATDTAGKGTDPLSVAIVGAGPGGCFAAQAIRKAFPQAEIDMVDRLPTPYGLVRYGVAADHQGTKSVARQFERLFVDEGVRFHGGASLGADYSLEELRERADVVVLATGVAADAKLGIAGEQLSGVYGSGQVTRLLNCHPDETGDLPRIGSDLVVIGQGNVALDVARLMAAGETELTGSDVNDDVHARLSGAVRTIHLVGRSSIEHAKFDPLMVRELAKFPHIRHEIHGDIAPDVPDGKDARVDVIRELIAHNEADNSDDTPEDRIQMHWWFGMTPRRIEGAGSVENVVFEATHGNEVRVAATSVVTAIGFVADRHSPEGHDPGAYPDGKVEPGLYVAGWLRRGPKGAIPDQRSDAQSLANAVQTDLLSGAIAPGKTGARGMPGLEDATDFTGWRRIDHWETSRSASARARRKLGSVEEMLRIARDVSIQLPQHTLAQPHDRAAVTDEPITILYATESGNAELIAEDLRGEFAEGSDVRLVDLGGAAPEQLDPTRLHLLICSTYGDGEVPTAAQPFYESLSAGAARLDGLRYAVFGLGDRSYTKTYSRGSELLDGALERAGATRVGTYGRHDASGPVEGTEAALEWMHGVLSEVSAVTRVAAYV